MRTPGAGPNEDGTRRKVHPPKAKLVAAHASASVLHFPSLSPLTAERERERESYIRNNLHSGVVSACGFFIGPTVINIHTLAHSACSFFKFILYSTSRSEPASRAYSNKHTYISGSP